MVVVVVATICALAWMTYRVTVLLNIPIPTLVKILGLDLPAPPRVSLHGISSDTITLHWSLPEKAGSVAKHIIQINGINVGESEKRGETSVTVTGLNPDQRYNVRVIAANAANFQAPGQLIRLRTRQKLQSSSDAAGQLVSKGDSSDDSPSIHTTVPDTPASPQHHHGHHHHQQHHHPPRRSARDRRSSPATIEQYSNSSPSAEDQHTVESLTRDLDAVRKEIQETEMQLAHAEEEYKAAESVLRAELDTLKYKKNEEDAGRQKLRAETKSLEESRRAAETQRSKTEKLLRAKQQEIKKMKDDVARWEDERIAALEKVDELSRAAEESKENAITTENDLSDDIKEAQSNIAEMEEEIRTLVGQIKALEAQKEALKAEEDEEGKRAKEEREKERLWTERRRELEMRYVAIYNEFQAAELDYVRSTESLMAFQGRAEGGIADVTPQKKPKQRRNRNRKSRTQTGSSPINSYALQDARFSDTTAFSNLHFPQNSSPKFTQSIPSSPFFNYANGVVTAPAEMSDVSAGTMSDDRLAGGAPMSPTANSLLPSNLFSFEDSPPSPKGSDAQPNSTFDPMGFMGPHSPISSGSVSTSPRSSFNQIPMFQNIAGESNPSESERPSSISPIGSHRQLSTTNDESVSSSRKFVRLFSNSFNRQRGKTLPIDGPAIGSLKSSESHSFPKNDPPGLDPIGTRRRSGSYGSSWSGLDFLHKERGKKPLERTNSDNSKRSMTFNQFNPNFDPIDPVTLFENPTNSTNPTSPRPSSIASFENALPAPSSNVSAAFGWPTPIGDPTAPRNRLSLGNHWSDFHLSRSRPVSRPMSPNANFSTASLSVLPSQQQLTSSLFPAATNPSARPVTPKLNPAAPSFQSMNNPSPAPSALTEPILKDNLSIHTDISTASTNDTNSGVSLESVPTKESLLSRFSLARKGSTGKFNITSWKKDGGFFGRGRKDVSDDEAIDQISEMGSSVGSRGLWPGWRKEVGGEVTEDEDDVKEKEKDTITPATTPLTKESSPWIKGSQSGFFGTIGRKKAAAAEEKEDEDAVVVGKEEKEKKREGLGIFRRRGKEEDKEKAEIEGSADEA